MGYKAKRDPGSSVMTIESRIKNTHLPAGYELKEVDSFGYVEDFKDVIKSAFEKDDMVIGKMFSSKENLFSDSFKSFLIYNDKGKAVSAAITSIDPVSAGIYYVATLGEERSKGLGKAITQASTNIAFNQGKDIVILQASVLGEYVYEQLGYNKIGEYKSYYLKHQIHQS